MCLPCTPGGTRTKSWGRASNLCTDFQQLCVPFPADIKWAPGFPVLPPQSDLQASAPGVPRPVKSPSPTRHHTVRQTQGPNRDHLTACIPGPGLRAREEASHTRSFSVRWVEGGAGPKDSVYLKQGARGNRRYGAAGPGKPWPGRTRQQRLQAAPQAATCPTQPPPVTGSKASSRAFSVTSSLTLQRSALGPR